MGNVMNVTQLLHNSATKKSGNCMERASRRAKKAGKITSAMEIWGAFHPVYGIL